MISVMIFDTFSTERFYASHCCTKINKWLSIMFYTSIIY